MTQEGFDDHETGELEQAKTDAGEGKERLEEGSLFSVTFHVETIRLISHIALLFVFVQGALITEFSGLDTIPDKEATEIFRIFAFNHTCNWIDHNPARMIAAIFIPFFTVPMLGYITLTHLRLARSVKKGQVPKWLLQTSRILSPFNFLAISLLHMWFVNNPEDTYGFIAHYIPYLTFQLALAFMGLINVQYLISTNNLPFGVRPAIGWAYQGVFVVLTFISILCVIILLADSPILDTRNSETERAIFRAISAIYGFMILVICPIRFSAVERRNGDTITLGACR